MTLMDPNPVFKVTTFLKSNISKRCILGTKWLKNTNRKSYTIYRMIPFSMTLSDLWPGFQGHDIFWSRLSENRRVLKTKLLLHNRKLYLTYGMVLFGDLDWPVNASRGFVSISWASCCLTGPFSEITLQFGVGFPKVCPRRTFRRVRHCRYEISTGLMPFLPLNQRCHSKHCQHWGKKTIGNTDTDTDLATL